MFKTWYFKIAFIIFCIIVYFIAVATIAYGIYVGFIEEQWSEATFHLISGGYLIHLTGRLIEQEK